LLDFVAIADFVCLFVDSIACIIIVLDKLLEYVQTNLCLSPLSCGHELILQWYNEVHALFSAPPVVDPPIQLSTRSAESSTGVNIHEEERSYGGSIRYNRADKSTHWTESTQLLTWWKNNIERKRKFKLIQNEACYSGDDHKRCQRFATRV
jgi:hypothetical protein